MLRGCYTFLGSIFSFTQCVSEANLKHLKESMLFNEYPVLEDFFRDRKDEVKKMTHLDYTWEKREQMIRKEEFEQGIQQEKQNTAVRMLKLQIPMEQIAQAVGESVETVEGWLKEA